MNKQTKTVKYTIGPWRSRGSFNTVFGPYNGNPTIATVNRLPRDDYGSQQANARLIATAPELLQVLKYYLIMHTRNQFKMPEYNENERKSWMRIKEMAQSVIAKAEGKNA